MKDNLTEIVAILDRSGSMNSIIDDAIGGFNTFLKEQKECDGEANMTVVLFDDKYEVLHDNVAIDNVVDMTSDTYTPRGMTALYDAIGKTVNTVGERLAKMDEKDRPAKVAVVIVTDGMENASKEFDHLKVSSMIEKQKNDYSWEFIFLSSDLDAVKNAQSFGVNVRNTKGFDNTGDGVRCAYSCASSSLKSYRGGKDMSLGDND